MSTPIPFTLNGWAVTVTANPARSLAEILREELRLTGTKIGCSAGDCGACTVRLDGRQVCACLVPAGRVAGRQVVTVEGLAQNGRLSALQESFLVHGAAQCGICTPGMLMAADDLLARTKSPTEAQVLDALGGVLCRCTGYRKIVDAVLAFSKPAAAVTPAAGQAVGARLVKVDGAAKVTGAEEFGADDWPADCLVLRAVRSPHHRARFTFGDLEAFRKKHPGLVRILTWKDIPGQNLYGIYPTGKDQPALAEGVVRHRGEAVCALVGDAATIASIRDEDVPIVWDKRPPMSGLDAALASNVEPLHADKPDNVLVRGRVVARDAAAGIRGAAAVARGNFETAFVEHAYIEPEAGYARRVSDRIEIVACTQTPYMDRDELALILGLKPEQVRIVPTAVGGGFGGKLDLSLQPLIATAAWLLNRPVRCVYTRPESMASTPKRHPARISATFACDARGKLTAVEFHGDFNTGAYASWGPTVANRVPVHAMGPYEVPAVKCTSRAIYTTDTPAGAFRGFGVPQAAIAHEALMDELALQLGIDELEFRAINVLKKGSMTATGQKLEASAGLGACVEALRPRWNELREAAERFNRAAQGPMRRGVGIGCMWYGIGNTSLSNPSTMKVGLGRDGALTLYSGAVDIGQGSNTVMLQICADALGVPVSALRLVAGDTDLTADAGKTSASRQTFVSGNAARLAGEDLRRQILRLANVGESAAIELAEGRLVVREGSATRTIDLESLPAGGLMGTGRYDPPTTPLDGDGQGVPYATYAFAAQLAEVEVDIELGTTKVRRIVAAHDVGRAINPAQVEGQIHGGVAQGLGLALMEEYIPGRTENLHDYLIPTFGDVPEIETILVEDREPLGPYGAKGIGEPALVPTAPAILGAIRHATGARIRRVPATPDRVRAAIVAQGRKKAAAE
ncbi:MAG: 2Fe-2S iron-sulfur cluster binding domain-containing protein [Alphaproteobacteria bacterium]|nr:2Fe-2S iron-sulfur cluster binding domain-containing protein [Alphaproteobacteria bacterium]